MGSSGSDSLGASRHPNTLAYMGTHQSFAEENQIVYHIDGVLTTHTGEVLGSRQQNFNKLVQGTADAHK